MPDMARKSLTIEALNKDNGSSQSRHFSSDALAHRAFATISAIEVAGISAICCSSSIIWSLALSRLRSAVSKRRVFSLRNNILIGESEQRCIRVGQVGASAACGVSGRRSVVQPIRVPILHPRTCCT